MDREESIAIIKRQIKANQENIKAAFENIKRYEFELEKSRTEAMKAIAYYRTVNSALLLSIGENPHDEPNF